MRNPTSFASRRCTESCAGRAELRWEGGAHRRGPQAVGRGCTEGLGLGAGQAVHQAVRDRAAWERSPPPGIGGRSKGGQQQHQGQQPQGQPLSEAAAAENGCSTRRRHLRIGRAQASGMQLLWACVWEWLPLTSSRNGSNTSSDQHGSDGGRQPQPVPTHPRAP